MDEEKLREKLIDWYMIIFGTDYFELFCKLAFIIMAAILAYSFFFTAKFKLTHLYPILTEYTSIQPDIKAEPIQIDYKKPKHNKITGDRGNKYDLEYVAKYSISGLTTATNTNFWLRGSMRNQFDEVALYDIGLVWGDLADLDLIKKYNISFKSVKTLGFARQLQPRIKGYNRTFPLSMAYFDSHLSHTHVIPANDNIMSALLTIKKYDKVKLDGYLTDIVNSDGRTIARTSMSRTDTNPTSRGFGACEVMYVTSVQIDKKVYK